MSGVLDFRPNRKLINSETSIKHYTNKPRIQKKVYKDAIVQLCSQDSGGLLYTYVQK
jgi:hypothetical protein